MKKYIPILIGVMIGWILSFTNCANPLIADSNDTNSIGKYAVSITGGDKNGMTDRIIYCVIIDTETGNVISKTEFTPYDFD